MILVRSNFSSNAAKLVLNESMIFFCLLPADQFRHENTTKSQKLLKNKKQCCQMRLLVAKQATFESPRLLFKTEGSK